MHWLLNLDIALFHFINGHLGNPFFDWLMPILSGHGVYWLPFVVLIVPIIIFFGSNRLRICSLLLVLTVAIGDPLIVGSIKDAVGRHRPCIDVHDAVQRLGCTTSGSMPSAHAANCFAMAAILFLFYRRTIWFMVPFASAVAFSRVYCGVHYPSDVAAGAILGATYGIIFAYVAQAIWQFVGVRAFPRWHSRLPNLLRPEKPAEDLQLRTAANIEWRRVGYILIFLALVGRLFYLNSGILNLTEDEAYQWLWSKHLALSYYSKPPGIALIQWAGTHLFGDREFGVRFFSPVFAAILSFVVFRFMAREIGSRAALFLLLATFATPLLLVGSVLMTIDPPLVLCWMWAVVAGWRAAQPDGKTHHWLIVGLAMGLGFLCKYTAMLQVICWVIFFALQPYARHHLRKAGPWLALGVFLICTTPVLIWNSQHGWITVNHVAGDAGLTNPNPISLSDRLSDGFRYFTEFTGAEAGLLNPIFFLGALWAMFAAWQHRRDRPFWFFLFCMSAPVFLGHWLYSFHSRVQPNWIAAAVPPMFCLMAAYWSTRSTWIKPWYAIGIVIGIVGAVFLHDDDLIGRVIATKIPGDKDPLHRARGWRETAQVVETERENLGTNTFIIADHYGPTGLFTFYSAPARAAATNGTPLVYCVASDRIINQFPFWDEYNYREHRQGQNALFVLRLDPYPLEKGWLWKWLNHEPIRYREIPAPRAVPDSIAAEFESVTNLGVREIALRDGRVFQRVQLFACYSLKSSPQNEHDLHPSHPGNPKANE